MVAEAEQLITSGYILRFFSVFFGGNGDLIIFFDSTSRIRICRGLKL